MRHLRTMVLMGGIFVLAHCTALNAHPQPPSGYFPLSEGNEWVYTVYSELLDRVLRIDTIRVEDAVRKHGVTYYYLSTPWSPVYSLWTRQDAEGDIYWSDHPGETEHPLLLFSVDPGTGWILGGRHCMDSAVRFPCPPHWVDSGGDVLCISAAWRPGDCYDAYWSGTLKRGVGPVRWSLSGPGGAALIWDLIEFREQGPCVCKCHADPMCDGALDVLDLAVTIDVAFHGRSPETSHGCWCYAQAIHGPTDVDCSGTTDIRDIVRIINVVFWGADSVREFCHPDHP